MTDKDLKKLSRSDILELLLYQTRRANSLEARVKELELQLEQSSLSEGSSMLQETQARCFKMLQQAYAECDEMKRRTAAECKKKKAEAGIR